MRVQQLFVKHQSRIKAFILSLQPDFSEADDILQEVFLVVTRKAIEFKEGSNFMAWVLI
jgi:RNA polymerase sigma-70 factor (ECF subfamily)